jgi:hypothetical protein
MRRVRFAGAAATSLRSSLRFPEKSLRNCPPLALPAPPRRPMRAGAALGGDAARPRSPSPKSRPKGRLIGRLVSGRSARSLHASAGASANRLHAPFVGGALRQRCRLWAAVESEPPLALWRFSAVSQSLAQPARLVGSLSPLAGGETPPEPPPLRPGSCDSS